MLEYDEAKLHPLFEGLSQDSLKGFKRKVKDQKGIQKTYFPIIPDLNLIHDKQVGHTNPYHYTYDEFPKLKNGYFENGPEPWFELSKLPNLRNFIISSFII